MPIVCKEVYLPVNYDFISNNAVDIFGNFAELYKQEYGIDLHDLFELKKNADNNYYIHQKNTSKIYAVGFKEGVYNEYDNLAMPAIVQTRATVDSTSNLIVIGLCTRIEGGALIGGYGFRLRLSADNLTPASIDELDVLLWEI